MISNKTMFDDGTWGVSSNDKAVLLQTLYYSGDRMRLTPEEAIKMGEQLIKTGECLRRYGHPTEKKNYQIALCSPNISSYIDEATINSYDTLYDKDGNSYHVGLYCLKDEQRTIKVICNDEEHEHISKYGLYNMVKIKVEIK